MKQFLVLQQKQQILKLIFQLMGIQLNQHLLKLLIQVVNFFQLQEHLFQKLFCGIQGVGAAEIQNGMGLVFHFEGHVERTIDFGDGIVRVGTGLADHENRVQLRHSGFTSNLYT